MIYIVCGYGNPDNYSEEYVTEIQEELEQLKEQKGKLNAIRGEEDE